MNVSRHKWACKKHFLHMGWHSPFYGIWWVMDHNITHEQYRLALLIWQFLTRFNSRSSSPAILVSCSDGTTTGQKEPACHLPAPPCARSILCSVPSLAITWQCLSLEHAKQWVGIHTHSLPTWSLDRIYKADLPLRETGASLGSLCSSWFSLPERKQWPLPP